MKKEKKATPTPAVSAVPHPEVDCLRLLGESLQAAAKGKPIGDEAGLARVLGPHVGVLNSLPGVAESLLDDPVVFLERCGVKLTPAFRKELANAAAETRGKGPKRVSTRGRPVLRLSPEFARAATPIPGKLVETAKLALARPAGAADASTAALMPAFVTDLGLLPGSLAGLFGPGSRGVSVGLPGTLEQALSTLGWRVVFQIRSDFYQEVYDRFFAGQFIASIFLQLGGAGSQTAAVDPTFEYTGWFLLPFKVRLQIDTSGGFPGFTLTQTGPNAAGLRSAFIADVSVKSGGVYGDPVRFRGEFEQRGPIERLDTGTMGQAQLNRLFAANMRRWDPLVSYTDAAGNAAEVDAMVDLFIKLAILDYFAKELPSLAVSPPLPEETPFVIFEDAACTTISNPPDEAVTVVWGNGQEVFDEFLIPAARNATYGMSRAAFLFLLNENIPDLPVVEGDTEVTSMDTALRDGYIEIFGEGVQHGVLFIFDVAFSYSVRIVLQFDDQGNVRPVRDRADISLQAATAPVLGLVGLLFDLILDAIVEGLFGPDLADAVDEQLDFEENIESRFAIQFALGEITARFRDADITPNGVFFHGTLGFATS